VNDARGEVIANIATDRELVALNDGTPTRLDQARGSGSHIDVTFASSRLVSKCRWSVLNNAMGSDHNPILITIDERPVQ
jgi:endonuclease/exonuclease/phosphatase (EEP) superfamily protein YafD